MVIITVSCSKDSVTYQDLLKLNNELTEKDEEPMTDLRIVSIYVVDPDENLEPKDALVHIKENFMTDLTNEDILVDLELKEALANHNTKRIKIVDEDRSDDRGKEVMLKTVKIKDLIIKINTLQTF